ncbi:MAG: MFS transporter [Alphaproteobacteria bacterium]|nr:MFS transporter [Alphaproteobacteria bacterium]
MTPNRWLMLGALFLARTSLGFQFQTVATVAPLLVTDMGINFTEVGTLIGFFSALGFATALPAGLAGKRFGEKRAVLFGLGLMALGGFVMAGADGFWVAGVGRLMVGVGGVVITVTMVKLVGDLFEGREVVTAMAILMNSWPVGIALGLWTQGLIAEAWGWNAVFLVAGFGSLAGLLLVAFVYRAPVREISSEPQPDTSAVPKKSKSRISRREVTLITISGVIWTLFNGGFLMVMAFGPAMMVSRGSDVALSGLLISYGTVAYMIAIPLGAWLSEKWARPNLVMISSFAIGAVVVGLVPFVDAPLLLFVLAGVFIGIPTGNVMALTVEVVRSENRNTGTGIYYSVHHIGLTSMPILAGWLVDVTGDAAVPMIVGGVGTALAIVMLGLLRAVQRRPVRV